MLLLWHMRELSFELSKYVKVLSEASCSGVPCEVQVNAALPRLLEIQATPSGMHYVPSTSFSYVGLMNHIMLKFSAGKLNVAAL
jgi:hypothetical protein